jgi:tRNA pseudouridine38-40 synthase
MVNYLLIFTFDGLYFNGTQIQNDYYTVQGLLKEKLEQLFNLEIPIKMGSRLDKGVSAKEFIANFITEEKFEPKQLVYVLNRLLPNYIRILDCKFVPLEFVSRINSYMKRYEYNINFGKHNPLTDRFYSNFVYKCDIDKFLKTLLLFKGEHDFSNFISLDDLKEDKYKKIEDVKIIKENEYKYKIYITGKAFGRYQIRYMIGASLQVGLNKLNIDDIKNKLDGINKEHISLKADANGLILDKVFYKENVKD